MRKILALAFIIILGITLVSAIVEAPEVETSFFEKIINQFKNIFSIGTFSVIGDSQGCNLQPKTTLYLQKGQKLNPNQILNSECAGEGLADWFNNWKAWVEFGKNFNQEITCGSDECEIQFYCCPALSCSSPTTISCQIEKDSVGNTWYRCPNEEKILYYENNYKYCPSVEKVICWYKEAGSCKTREYSKSLCDECGKGECSSYMNSPLYNSQSTCNSAIECTNECKPLDFGKFCSSSTAYQTCEKSGDCYKIKITNCPSGQVCSNGECIVSGEEDEEEKEEEVKTLSLTSNAYNEATPEQIARAMFNLGYECPITNDKILTSEEINVEDYNWTIKCVSSVVIQETNRKAISAWLELQGNQASSWWEKYLAWKNQKEYEIFCEDKTLLNLIIRIPLITPDKCKTYLKDLPSGTCRATIKASEGGFCWQQANSWLSGITKSTNCQTNTIILIIITIAGFILIIK